VASAAQPIGWIQVAKLTPPLPVFSPLNCPKKLTAFNNNKENDDIDE
jgi:hypothetical protein